MAGKIIGAKLSGLYVTAVERKTARILDDAKRPVAARFVTTARFVTKVTKRAAMPALFVTNDVVTNRAGIAPFFSTWISVHVILYVSLVCVCVCE